MSEAQRNECPLDRLVRQRLLDLYCCAGGGRKNEDPLRPSRVAELKKPALSGLFVGGILFFSMRSPFFLHRLIERHALRHSAMQG